MDVVFYVCIGRRGEVGDRVWEVCVFRHADVVFCVLSASCSSSRCSVLYDVHF